MITLLAALFCLLPPGEDASWPQWRGPKRDNISLEKGLLQQWPAGGPALAWKTAGLGGGWSSVSVHAGRMYTLGDTADACKLFALDLDGKLVWSVRIGEPAGHKKYPGPRATPSTDGERIVVLGQHGDLVCLAAADGKEQWRVNLEKDFGGRMMSGWRYSESPLIDGDRVICTPGGSKGTLLALEKATGKPVWQSREITDAAAYGAVVPVEIAGVKQYLLYTDASVAGVAVADGKVLWRAARKGQTAVIPEPLYADGIVFVSSGYKVGCNAFKVSAEGGVFSAKELYSGPQLQNHHGGMILLGEHVYGVDDGGSLKCLELKTGREVWASPRLGKGSLAYADGRLYYRSESPRSPVLALFEASPAGCKEQGRFEQPAPSGLQTWAHPVVVGGRLYVRDQETLYAYSIKQP